MLCRRMTGSGRFRLLALATVAAASLAVSACGSQGIQLASDDPNYDGAKIFELNCSGCHTLSVAGTQGSAEDANGRERVDGPNFDQRKVEVDQVLYAIANGGYSSSYMPQDIVVGEEAQKVAEFLAAASGSEVDDNKGEPGTANPAGVSPDDSSNPGE
jgi:mono/diheme cytochrome c family protein